MTNDEGGMDPKPNGPSRVRARGQLEFTDEGGCVMAAEPEDGGTVLLTSMGRWAQQPSVMRLTSRQQRELADWLDPRLENETVGAVRLLREAETALALDDAGPREDLAERIKNWLSEKACNTVSNGQSIRVDGATGAITRLPAVPSCASCPFWEGGVQGDPKHGLCRFHPPAASGDAEGVWPETVAHDYCGQHPHFTTTITGTLLPMSTAGELSGWDRQPEDVAQAGTLTWAVAQTGAVRDGCGLWNVAGVGKLLTDTALIRRAVERAMAAGN